MKRVIIAPRTLKSLHVDFFIYTNTSIETDGVRGRLHYHVHHLFHSNTLIPVSRAIKSKINEANNTN